jgi:DNA-binding response OmpR family regulator
LTSTSGQGDAMSTLSLLKKRSMTVLVVEDDEDLREVLYAEFELDGLTVLTATNGSEAVTIAQQLKPDLILMDVMMPVMNGIESTKLIKTDNDIKHIPIIMLTAADKKEDIIEALAIGAIDYITKPFFMPELKARIKSVLEHKIMYDELKKIQSRLIKNERLQTMRELTEAVQGSVNEPLTVILGRIGLLRRKQNDVSEDDLRTLENAANRIRDIVNHLGIMECLYPTPFFQEAEFDDLAFMN